MGTKRGRRIGGEVKTKVLFRAASLFFDKRLKVADIAKAINREFKDEIGVPYTREAIYPMLAQARDRGFVEFVPPLGARLSEELEARFEYPGDRMRVVSMDDDLGAELVTAAAAGIVLEMIRELWDQLGRPVGLGLGPGRATLSFCRHLSNRLMTEPDIRPGGLQLHAITAGGDNMHPETAPISFFNVFRSSVLAKSVGFFAESLVRPRQFREMKSRKTVQEVLAERDKIDIVVTSRGDFSDKHDLLGELLRKEMKPDVFKRLYGGCVGNVQYRPYTLDGPMVESEEHLRVPTLFELEDFAEMATREDKRVVLLARSCSMCDEPDAESLRPLFEQPSLKVWSHVVMDSAMANGLLHPRKKAATS